MAELKFGRGVSDGWYKQFTERHPILSTRTCQFLTKASNSVDVTDVHMLFGTMAKLIIEGGSRIFNVDETAFQSQPVIAIRDSRNDRQASISLSSPVDVLLDSSPSRVYPSWGDRVAGGASWFERTGSRCYDDGVRIHEHAIVFTLASVLCCDRAYADSPTVSAYHGWLWLPRLAIYHPRCGCLPDQARMLTIQSYSPLSAPRRCSFKTKLNSALELPMNDSDDCNISKEKAMKLVGLAWQECNFSINIKGGFRACGLYSLSLHRMNDLLVFPPPNMKTRRRTTATVAGRLLTEEL
ncbi:LOW QUALITY PROTEIN: hypothetical protein PHMEG_0009507 [Phytophthora megakarya]|uniref:HTH CENPB-type domain-containing protein n=1 Tax=Phytophthora megakarya TaxID=4795 RepID=A0A225WIJ0_9STRA|nr:LOW QUALITY PROTEIN: hypothetical protein PHMEG_0009507 [Phytophthora megakarya]